MPTKQAAPSIGADQFAPLLLSEVHPSPTNPRQTYNPVKITELGESIRSSGLVQPIIVRPRKSRGYECVAGERRRRASLEAGMTTIAGIIRHLSDTQVLEIQLIENAQREDVPAREEGVGYARLLKIKGYTAEIIAEKTGHDVGHIYKRLRLAHLIPEAGKLLDDGTINIGHANVLARLEPKYQALALKNCLFVESWNLPGVDRTVKAPISVKDFERVVRETIMIALANAPWSLDDPLLVSVAGACAVCTKHTGANKKLFDDVGAADLCLDSVCYQKKQAAHLVQITAAAVELGEPLVMIASRYGSNDKALNPNQYTLAAKRNLCNYAESAVYVDGAKTGHQVHICRDPKCKIHKSPNHRIVGETRASKPVDYWGERAKKLKSHIAVATRRTILERLLVARQVEVAGTLNLYPGLLRALCLALLTSGTSRDLIRCLPKAIQSKFSAKGDTREQFKKIVRDQENEPYLGSILIGLAFHDTSREFCSQYPANDNIVVTLHHAAKACLLDPKAIGATIEQTMTAEFNLKRKTAEDKKKANAPKKAAKRAATKKTTKKAKKSK